MQFLIPLRLITAIAGLVMGYYVGYWIEVPAKQDTRTQQLIHARLMDYFAANMFIELADDSDDDDPAELYIHTVEIDSDDNDTDYSDEEAK